MWEKIVLNFLSNAFKFTLQGRIEMTMRRDAPNVSLTVTDTGVGIPEAELPRIFERFHRIEGPHGRTYEGTGIGLALVQELVRQHGGEISVHSRIGQGTTFTVTIPLRVQPSSNGSYQCTASARFERDRRRPLLKRHCVGCPRIAVKHHCPSL